MSHTPQAQVIRNRLAKQRWLSRAKGTPITRTGGQYSAPLKRVKYVNRRHKAKVST